MILEHYADDTVQRIGIIFSDIDAVDVDLAARWRIETQQKLNDGCFPCAVDSYQRNAFVRSDRKAYIRKHILFGCRIAERNIPKLDHGIVIFVINPFAYRILLFVYKRDVCRNRQYFEAI